MQEKLVDGFGGNYRARADPRAFMLHTRRMATEGICVCAVPDPATLKYGSSEKDMDSDSGSSETPASSPQGNGAAGSKVMTSSWAFLLIVTSLFGGLTLSSSII